MARCHHSHGHQTWTAKTITDQHVIDPCPAHACTTGKWLTAESELSSPVLVVATLPLSWHLCNAVVSEHATSLIPTGIRRSVQGLSACLLGPHNNTSYISGRLCLADIQSVAQLALEAAAQLISEKQRLSGQTAP